MGALWGALSAASIGVSDLFGRRVVAASTALTGAVVMQFFAMIVSFGAVFVLASDFGGGDFLLGAFSGLGLATGLACYYAGLSASSSTVVAPLVATMSAVIPFVYTLVRGASASSLAIVAAAVAFVGLGIITMGSSVASNVRAGLRWGVVSGLGYGFGLSVIIEVSEASGSWPAVSQRLAALVFLLAITLARRLPAVPPPGQRANGVAAGAVGGLTTIFYLLGVQADAPTAVVTASMFPVASVAIGYLYYRDPVSRMQLLGIAIVLAGVVGVVTG